MMTRRRLPDKPMVASCESVPATISDGWKPGKQAKQAHVVSSNRNARKCDQLPAPTTLFALNLGVEYVEPTGIWQEQSRAHQTVKSQRQKKNSGARQIRSFHQNATGGERDPELPAVARVLQHEHAAAADGLRVVAPDLAALPESNKRAR
jgi:hypothetical protein